MAPAASLDRARRILLIAYYYPPDQAVGALRPGRLAEALRARGHDVQVIACGAPDDSDTPGLHRVRALTHPREWLQRARAWRRGSKSSVDAVNLHAAGGAPITTRSPAWKRWLLSAIWTPDDRQGFIWPAIRRATAIAEEAPIDAIYTSAPPFSVHLAGLMLRRQLGVPWIAEFRDPWLDGMAKGAHVRSRGMDAIERWMERRCLATADEVVTVTHGAARAIGRKRAILDRPAAYVIPSGIDTVRSARSARPDGPLRVLYLGTLYHGRDPRPLFRAVGALRRSGRLAPDAPRFEFVGDCRWFHDRAVAEMAEDAGIGDCVSFQDPVSHDLVNGLLEDADLLLLLAQRQPAQVPHKLYEYLGAARPILAWADEAGETAAMLRKSGGHHIVTESTDECAAIEVVAAALQAAARRWTPDMGTLEEWTTERQLANAVNLIERTT